MRSKSSAWKDGTAVSDTNRRIDVATLSMMTLIALALLHGLVYLTIVPPWQHYDEPTHFEYVRFIAILGYRPAVNAIDLSMSREIADSMFRFQFWPPNVRPDLLSPTPPNIGFNEKVHPALYYAVAAIPVRQALGGSIESQLYAARMVAVVLYGLLTAGTWRITAILLPERSFLHILVPVVLILVPAFADQMSAVNNDSLVNFSVVAMLLGCVLLIRDGPRPVGVLLAVLGLLVAVATKRTAVVAIVPFFCALFWSLSRRPFALRVWVGVLGVSLAAFGYAALEVSASGLVARPWLLALNQQYLRLPVDTFTQPNATNPRAYLVVLQTLFTSFWLDFGWGHVMMGWIWPIALFCIVAASLIGFFVGRVRLSDELLLWQRRVLWLFALTVCVAVVAAILRFALDPSHYVPRGRYVHVAIVPIIVLMILGLETLLPVAWKARGLLLLTGFFVVMDVTAWAGVLSSFYYR